nr:hypothetical protein [Bacteroidota bacterium]
MLASQSVLAEKVLASATGYSSNKKIIHNSFFNQNDELSLESVKLRLIAIDSTYSTQMSKRLFGITDLAKELLVISEGKDSVIRKKLISYLKAPLPEDDIGRILIKPFGLTKSGEVGGVATSLLSKYFYFLLDFKFPIYDSLVRDVLPLLNNKFKILAKTSFGSNSDRSPYFKTLLEFNKLSKINDI